MSSYSNGNGNSETKPHELAKLEPEILARAVSLDRQEIDLQVSTAKQYPRSLSRFREEVLSLATVDLETARACTYALPRAGKVIVGPSVRFLEVIASSWGNLREEKRAILPGPDESVVRGVAIVWDLERNRAVRAEVTRRITDRNGTRYNDDMVQTTANAAASIAHRNALKSLIPEGFWRAIWLKVQEVGAGNARTVAENRAKWLEHWSKQGISAERVFSTLEVEGLDDIGTAELATMQGLYSAIKAGDLTPAESFPAAQATPEGTVPVGTFGFTKRATAKLVEQARAAAEVERNPDPAPAQEKPAASPASVAAARLEWINQVINMSGRDALTMIESCGMPEVLIRLANVDKRRGVVAAARARAATLSAVEPSREPERVGVTPGELAGNLKAISVAAYPDLIGLERAATTQEEIDAIATRLRDLEHGEPGAPGVDFGVKPEEKPSAQAAHGEDLPWQKHLGKDPSHG